MFARRSRGGHGSGAAADGSSNGGAVGGDARRVRVRFVGQVQGVGFRWTSQRVAFDLGLSGWVRNEPDGSVSMELQGPDEAVSTFFTRLLESYRHFPISYTIDAKEDIPPMPGEAEFSVRF
ncbi:MAG: acylphosphatase [Coriobacteriaceae bacterium]|nr:acylphosphatase [Coriobacteriaceae bacterium]